MNTTVVFPHTNLKIYISTCTDFTPSDGSQIAQVIICFIVSKCVKHRELPSKQIMSQVIIWKTHTNGKYQTKQFKIHS